MIIQSKDKKNGTPNHCFDIANCFRSLLNRYFLKRYFAEKEFFNY